MKNIEVFNPIDLFKGDITAHKLNYLYQGKGHMQVDYLDKDENVVETRTYVIYSETHFDHLREGETQAMIEMIVSMLNKLQGMEEEKEIEVQPRSDLDAK